MEEWYATLDEESRAHVDARIEYLAERGPGLGRPIADTITTSRHSNMKELIVPGNIRVLYVFDPLRQAVLLVGGDKTNQWKSWYKASVPLADDRFDDWLARNQVMEQQQPKHRPRKGR